MRLFYADASRARDTRPYFPLSGRASVNQCQIASLLGTIGSSAAARENAATTGMGRKRHWWMGQ